MASTSCLADKTFGPRVDTSCRSFDFTLLFEDIFLTCLPIAVFLSLLPSHVTVLAKSPAVSSVRSKLLGSKLTILTGILVTQIILLALRTRSEIFQTNASITADTLSIVGTAGAAWVSYIDHQRSLRPSTLLSLYLSTISILDIARVRTLWLIGSQDGVAAAMTATLALSIVALVLESTEKKSSLKEEKRSGAPEEYSGFWKRTVFAWLVSTFRAGYAKIISVEDLPKLDTRLKSHALRDKLGATWANYDRKQRHSLLKACFRSNLVSFLSGVPPRLCKSAFTLVQPLLINATVRYVGQAAPDPSYGKGLIGAYALVFLGLGFSTGLASYQTTRFTTRLSSGLIGLVYRETMRARTVDLGETTAIALMGTDVERISQNFIMIHEVWAAVIEVGVAIFLLEQQIFIACLAPIAVIIVCFFATGPIATGAKTAQKAWIEKVQARLRITSAILDDMKAVKMLGLSNVVSGIIDNLRKVEIKTSSAYRKLLVWTLVVSNGPGNIAPVVTFGVYAIIAVFWKNDTLLTAQAFTSIALINVLVMPVMLVVQIIPRLLQCVGSFDRIQEYCNYAESSVPSKEDHTDEKRPQSSISLQSLPPVMEVSGSGHSGDAIAVEKQNFAWAKDKPAFLKDIDLRVKKGAFTMVVGAVGSGKTMLLESILGETLSGPGSTVQRAPSVAYCAQQPWLENGTIRSNIIGVSQYDQRWYRTVLSACGLDLDIQALENGDQTIVGSKGVNLSGGQKQRIAIARAVYSRRDTVIFDDIFSGMDAHTIELVSRRLFGGNGIFRTHKTTVILATHSHKLMTQGDTIIALEDGKIAESGTPQALLSSDGYVAKLDLKMREEEEEEKEENEPQQEEEPNSDKIALTHVQSTAAESITSVAVTPAKDKDTPDATRKKGNWSVYTYYFRSSGYLIVALYAGGMFIWDFFTEFPTVWLDWWSTANENEPNKDLGMYVGIYAFFGVFGITMAGFACWIGFVFIVSNSSYRLHRDLLDSTIRAPLRFFTATDTGTLTNRFSQDMELIDMALPILMVNYTTSVFGCLCKAIILIVFSQYLAATLPFVRLIEIESKAPLFTHFTESVAGAATIRAYGWQSQYEERNFKRIDQAQRPAYMQHMIQHWLAFVLDMVVAALAVILVAIVVTWKDKFTAGNVGVSLVMIMGFSMTLMRTIKMWTMMESSIGAVARVKRFVADTESEEKAGWTTEVADEWPRQGVIEFKSLVASHNSDAEPVIQGVSLAIKAAEHVAICGRSGSGKTSLILALLQMVETRSGQITVDDIDVGTVACTDVRSHLNVVPQDPFLLPGTVRFNIDPFGRISDDEIIRALESVRLWGTVQEQGGLEKEMDTAAWSAGQKQLLCLARAVVRKSKVLILDEATSSVDAETEAIMQDIIDTTFKDCTVLAVMHRLKHVTRYDKVALLDNGSLVEFDTPTSLIGQQSRFADLYSSSTK
ncbi:hypothetical protein TruAng_010313 [Truncatella angustata]|nr:hypothetical protein TruAng_010313 [Truncatella angustata]